MTSRLAVVDAWLRRPQRERSAVAFVAAVVAAAIAIFAVIVPLTGAVARTRSDLVRTQALLAAARAQRATESTLARHTPLTNADPAAAVASVFARYALVPLARPQATPDGSVEVIVAAAPFDALVQALDALARADNLHVERAVLTALADAGSVRAEVRLRRGAAR